MCVSAFLTTPRGHFFQKSSLAQTLKMNFPLRTALNSMRESKHKGNEKVSRIFQA